MSYEHRHHHEFHPADRFESLLLSRGFDLRVIPRTEHDQAFTLDDVELWSIMRCDAPTAALAAAGMQRFERRPPRHHIEQTNVQCRLADALAAKQATKLQDARLRGLLETVWPTRTATVIKARQKLSRCGVSSVAELRALLHNDDQVPDDPHDVELNCRLRAAGLKIFGRQSLLRMHEWLVTNTAASDVAPAATLDSSSPDGIGGEGGKSDPSFAEIDTVKRTIQLCFGSSSDEESNDSDDGGGGKGTALAESATITNTSAPRRSESVLLREFVALVLRKHVDLRSPWIKVCDLRSQSPTCSERITRFDCSCGTRN